MIKGSVAIGIDIGGTKINAAAYSNGKIISEVLSYLTQNSLDGILNTVLQAIETLKDQYQAKYIGIATAGTVDIDNSKVTGSTGNLPKGYSSLDFKKIIEEKYGLKTLIENDANAAGYAEYVTGSAKGHKNTILITLGTGIGGGIIVDGKLLKGKSGAAAECGHVPIAWGKQRACTCGGWDCWEAYASGTGYAKNAQEMAKTIPVKERAGILKDIKPEELTTYAIMEGLKKGDDFAKKVDDKWQDFIIIGLTIYANVFDPDSIVLSGGMAPFVNIEKVQKGLDERIVVPKVKVIPAKSGNYAGVIGAAALALEKFDSTAH